jgi:hypothetical protein
MSRTKTGLLAFSTFFIAGLASAQTDIRDQRFTQRDDNRDGYLSLSEYGGHPGNFRALDRSGDNRLSREEFVWRQGQGPRIVLPDQFAYLDLDGDGTLNRAEWYGQDPAFERVDRNRDGRITRDEQTRTSAADDRQDRFYGRDQDGNGVLSRREWRDEDVAFRRADASNDGVVSLREYLDMPLRAIDGDARFDQLDRDGNGTLSSREWRTDAGAFYLADRNRDGRVTVAEFLAHADDDSVERFRSMDRNRDGYVSRAEWNGPLDSFVRRDRNRDGRVSRAEFGDAFTSRR